MKLSDFLIGCFFKMHQSLDTKQLGTERYRTKPEVEFIFLKNKDEILQPRLHDYTRHYICILYKALNTPNYFTKDVTKIKLHITLTVPSDNMYFQWILYLHKSKHFFTISVWWWVQVVSICRHWIIVSKQNMKINNDDIYGRPVPTAPPSFVLL
jgi:hypothetical protein